LLTVRTAGSLYSAPEGSATVIATLHPGQRVRVLSGPVTVDEDPWYEVSLGAWTGWTSGGPANDLMATATNGPIAVGIPQSAEDPTPSTVFVTPDGIEGDVLIDRWLGAASWTPDGARMVGLEEDFSIAIVRADGTREPVGPGWSPAWSWDGRRLAYLDEFSQRVIVRNEGGSEEVIIRSELEIDAFAWSPDGSRIAVSTVTCADCEPAISAIQVVELATGEVIHLTYGSQTHCGPGSLGWSPDGQSIGFVRVNSEGPTVWSVPAAGGDPVPLAAAACQFAWSPDGALLAFSARGGISVANADGSGSRVLVSAEGDPYVSRPSWSPDGREILFHLSCDECESSDPAVVTASAAPGDFRTISYVGDDGAWQPVLSPLP
jgi:dipeptidyl aminopeptidase/acylaminoacyl peptidase